MKIKLLAAAFLLSSPAWAGSQSVSDIEKVQRALIDWHYDPGEVNGELSAQTRFAIEQYERDWGLDVTGEIDVELIERLTREHSDTQARMQNADNADCRLKNVRPQARETLVYSGPCPGGTADGDGVVTWRYMLNGNWQEEIYEGGLKNGRLDGYGSIETPFEGTYEGEYRAGLRHGNGRFTDPSGSVYQGQFEEGLFHGKGTYVSVKLQYDGEWRRGRRSGLGKAKWPNGDQYEGGWQGGKRWGEGIYVWANGSRYEGSWANGKADGFGTLFSTGKEPISGNWRNGCLTIGKKRLAIDVPIDTCRR